eukprot:gnl/Trimastix_PCT/849.p1 GENE.gnl/Trimastix_PCT/849~~gnl/Trimastix_PCT/849.p1  ORF type:complete len:522 (+),score=84.60 gnl/Trimastix_PCT/849:150-1568(+)
MEVLPSEEYWHDKRYREGIMDRISQRDPRIILELRKYPRPLPEKDNNSLVEKLTIIQCEHLSTKQIERVVKELRKYQVRMDDTRPSCDEVPPLSEHCFAALHAIKENAPQWTLHKDTAGSPDQKDQATQMEAHTVEAQLIQQQEMICGMKNAIKAMSLDAQETSEELQRTQVSLQQEKSARRAAECLAQEAQQCMEQLERTVASQQEDLATARAAKLRLEGTVLRLQQNSAVANITSRFPIPTELKAAYETFLEDTLINLWNELAETAHPWVNLPSLHANPSIRAAQIVYEAVRVAHRLILGFHEMVQPIQGFFEESQAEVFQAHHERFLSVDKAVEYCMHLFEMQFPWGPRNSAESTTTPDTPPPLHNSFKLFFSRLVGFLWSLCLLSPACLKLHFDPAYCAYHPGSHSVQEGSIRGDPAQARQARVWLLAPRLMHCEVDPLKSKESDLGQSVMVKAYVIVEGEKSRLSEA